MEDEKLDPSQSTRDWIDLKIASLKSEMRLLFVLSVAGNTLLAHVALSPTVAYIGGGATFLGGMALKVASFWR